MNVGGSEAADQMVRMMLSGGEVAVRLSGSAIKNMLAMSLALAKSRRTLSGRVGMSRMLRETRDLRVFPMSAEKYRQFQKLAGRQKLLYSAIRDQDGRTKLVDVVLPVTELDRANVIFQRMLYQPEREAQRESQMTLRLVEQFLTAGIEAGPALRTVNTALNLRGDEQGSFTTIDLLEADLQGREAVLYKYGAAPTYVKRQGSVRRLTGAALPAGLQDTAAVPTPARFPLEENTFLLMVSDGVADSGDDQWLQDLLAGWQGDDPNVLVSLVLRECYQRRKGDDDRSAMCLYLPPQNRGRREV